MKETRIIHGQEVEVEICPTRKLQGWRLPRPKKFKKSQRVERWIAKERGLILTGEKDFPV